MFDLKVFLLIRTQFNIKIYFKIPSLSKLGYFIPEPLNTQQTHKHMGNAQLNCQQCQFFQLQPESYITEIAQDPNINKNRRQSITNPTGTIHPNAHSVLVHSKPPIQESTDSNANLNKVKVLFQGGIEYYGDIVDGKRQGRGRQVWPDGTFYDGEWKDDMANGKGVFKQFDGGDYEGDFKNDRFHGIGKFITGQKNLIYEGEFFEHMQHGYGTEISLTEKYKYMGNFKNDVKQGHGYIEYQNGSSYDGLWKNGKFDGQGHYISPSMEYKGGWKQNKLHGYGVAVWKDGRIYEGQYINGKKQGKGTYTYSDGRKYIGDWLSALQHGYGEIHYPNGEVKRGRWFNGKEDNTSATS